MECVILGHQGHCLLSGDMLDTGCPRGSRSHVAIQRMSVEGRWRCLWNISSQLSGPILGKVIVLGVLGAVGRSMLRSVGRAGVSAMVFGRIFSIFLQADRPLRRGSRGGWILRCWVISWIMLLGVGRS